MKKLLAAVIVAVVAVIGLAGFEAAKASNVYTGRFDHPSNIIRGGTMTKSEFSSRYNQNKTKDLPAIFSHYGINAGKINQAKEAVVHADGRVVVDGKTVANNAWAVGRQTLGSNQARAVKISGKTYYEKPVAQSIHPYKAVTAFVFLDKNGRFESGMLKACGNPITATPPKPPKPPQPPKKPEPAAVCKQLTATITDRNNYKLNAQASVSNGAKVSGYNYIIKDESGETVLNRTVTTTSTGSSISGELPAGKYTAEVIVKTSIGDRTGKACRTSFEIPEEEKPPVKYDKVCDTDTNEIVTIREDEFDEDRHSRDLDDCKEVPVTPEEPAEPEIPEKLPETGLADSIGAFIGLGSLIASSGYYLASRRGVLSAWMQR